MRWTVVIGLVLGVSLACAGGSEIRMPFHAYVDGTTAGTGVVLETCAMFGSSRKGRCRVSGPAADIQTWAAVWDLSPPSPAADDDFQSCLLDAPWGLDGVAAPGVTVQQVGPNHPPNTRNNKPERLYLTPDGTQGCLELSYPYG